MKAIASAACPLLLALALVGCSSRGTAGDADAIYNAGEQEAQLSPGLQLVRIGEGGPSFAACAAAGTVINVSAATGGYLPLRTAPFAEAGETARLANGTPLLLCSHSLDQHWLGVVVPKGGAPDCGVATPVAAPRGYAGPCPSGWVSSAFVQVRAN